MLPSFVTDPDMAQVRAIKKRVLEVPPSAVTNSPTLDSVKPNLGFGTAPYVAESVQTARNQHF